MNGSGCVLGLIDMGPVRTAGTLGEAHRAHRSVACAQPFLPGSPVRISGAAGELIVTLVGEVGGPKWRKRFCRGRMVWEASFPRLQAYSVAVRVGSAWRQS